MQIGMRGATLILILRAVGHLQLQLERGQRGTQRMRRIRNESTLMRECRTKTGQQIIQRIGKRANLIRQTLRGQRRQRSSITCLHLLGDRAQRRQPAPHRQPHDPPQQRQQDQQRRHRAQRHAGSHLVPRAIRLRDLHDRRPIGDAVDAP